MRGTVPLVVALAWMGACTGSRQQSPEARRQAMADSVSMAETAFDSTVFDTITWTSDTAAIDRGSVVYRISCSLCHGSSGRGDAGFVLRGDTLKPPSFLAADWRFGKDPQALREYIFHGNVAGMPYWGLVGLNYRNIDAVTRYIEGYLRVQYQLTS